MTPLGTLRLVERMILVALFLMMVALYSGSVVTREIGGTFASKFAWIEETVRLMNLFLVFLALGLALERGKHITIDILRNLLASAQARLLVKIIDVVGFVFSVYLVWLGIVLVKFVLMTNQRSPTLDIPMGWIYMAPVIGFGLLALRYALSFFGVIDRISGDQVDTGDLG